MLYVLEATYSFTCPYLFAMGISVNGAYGEALREKLEKRIAYEHRKSWMVA